MLFQLFSDPISLIGFLLAIVIGLTFHEYAHAWMAMRLGDMTAKYQGRLSLNPAKHFDPLGLIFLLLVGFGWGKPVPINPNAFKGRYDEIKVSIAGPITNLIIAFVFTIPIKIAEKAWGVSLDSNIALIFCEIIAEINVMLAVFNLIPIYPLDGSHILTSLAPASWKNGIDSFKRSSMAILLIIVFLEVFLKIDVLSPLMWIYRIIRSIISISIVDVIDGIKYLIGLI